MSVSYPFVGALAAQGYVLYASYWIKMLNGIVSVHSYGSDQQSSPSQNEEEVQC